MPESSVTISGIRNHVGSQHLQRYVNEFDFKYNTRVALGYSDSDRANEALKGIAGKSLTYRRIGGAESSTI